MRILKWPALAFLALVLVVAGTAWYLLVHDTGWVRGKAETLISQGSGRDVRIGHLDLHRGRLVVEDFHVSNVDWSREPEMASVERLEVVFKPLELLRGRL